LFVDRNREDFEDRAMWIIFGPKNEELTGGWRKYAMTKFTLRPISFTKIMKPSR
jgi:hypothetical protein